MRRLRLAVLPAVSLPASAGLFDKSPDKAAEEAAHSGLLAATIWIDASWGFRNQGAANS